MKLIEFIRVLPKTLCTIAINPDNLVWVQKGDEYSTILMMESGPEIEVRDSYRKVMEKLNETP